MALFLPIPENFPFLLILPLPKAVLMAKLDTALLMAAREFQNASMAHLGAANGKKSAPLMRGFHARFKDVLMPIERAIVAEMNMVFVCPLMSPKGF